jgi:ribosomal protein L7/L12
MSEFASPLAHEVHEPKADITLIHEVGAQVDLPASTTRITLTNSEALLIAELGYANKVRAIKTLRALKNVGLRESKAFVEYLVVKLML